MSRLELNAVTVHTLETFRLNLIEEHELSVKTARNVIDGSLRAMLRDAGRRLELKETCSMNYPRNGGRGFQERA